MLHQTAPQQSTITISNRNITAAQIAKVVKTIKPNETLNIVFKASFMDIEFLEYLLMLSMDHITMNNIELRLDITNTSMSEKCFQALANFDDVLQVIGMPMLSNQPTTEVDKNLAEKKSAESAEFQHGPMEDEVQWAINESMKLSEYDEDDTIIMWMRDIKLPERTESRRLMVITGVRVFTAKRIRNKSFKITNEAHILALKCVQDYGSMVLIEFANWRGLYDFEEKDIDSKQKILGQLYKNYTFSDPGFPEGILSCKWLNQYKASQETDLRKKYPVIGDSSAPWERPARAFRSFVYFYKEPNKEKLSIGLSSLCILYTHNRNF